MHSWPKHILMVEPSGFRINYAINPYMLDHQGKLQNVDGQLAMRQWEELKATFNRFGMSIEVLPGDERFPDMVFCANQTLPFLDTRGEQQILLSRMHASQRKGEVEHFRRWAEKKGFGIFSLTDFDFEGAGDAIWNYETRELLGGYGFRSDEKVYDLIEEMVGVKVHRLALINPNFYHLDTCLAVLNGTAVAYVASAFAPHSLNYLKQLFTTKIEIDPHEAKMHFAGNCLSLDGQHVVLQKGATSFTYQLKNHGFTPVEVETTEFMKSGGSVFCMKQILF